MAFKKKTKHSLLIDNTRMMDSIESAYLKVTSPSGTSIHLKKIKISKASDAQKIVFKKFMGDILNPHVFVRLATKLEMKILLDISKL